MGTKGRDHLIKLQAEHQAEYEDLEDEEKEGLREWLKNKGLCEQHAPRLTQNSRAADVSNTLAKIEEMVSQLLVSILYYHTQCLPTAD